MLTRKMRDLLVILDQEIRESGVAPSFEELKGRLQLKSKSGVHRLITALEERGFVRRHPKRARALEVVNMPEALAKVSKAAAPTNVVHASFGRPAAAPSSVTLPLYGRIAAGLPIEALRDASSMIEVPAALLGGGEHYALQVAGDSMINAGILDGDTVVIRRGDIAENGAIVVALVDETEVTLKRLQRRGNTVALKAENPNYEPRVLGAERVKVQGRMVGLLRSY